MPEKKKSRPAQKIPLDYKPKNAKEQIRTMQIIKKPRFKKDRLKEAGKFKRFSYIGLGRTKKGRTPRSPGVPFERGSIGLPRKTSKSQVGSATGEKRELKRQTKKRQSSRGGSRR